MLPEPISRVIVIGWRAVSKLGVSQTPSSSSVSPCTRLKLSGRCKLPEPPSSTVTCTAAAAGRVKSVDPDPPSRAMVRLVFSGKLAASEPNYIQYISASTVITKLEQQWNVSKGKLPPLSKEDFKISEKIQETGPYYKKVMNDWLSWAQENPQSSFMFFEEYRRTWWSNDPLQQE